MTDSTWHDGAGHRYDDYSALLRVTEMDERDDASVVPDGRLHEWRTQDRALSPTTTDWVKTICCQPAKNDDAAKLCFSTQQTRLILADVLPRANVSRLVYPSA